MNPIRKTNIAGVAFTAAVFFASTLLAKPPAQNYPEYPMNEGAPTVTEQTAPVVKAEPVKATPAPAKVVKAEPTKVAAAESAKQPTRPTKATPPPAALVSTPAQEQGSPVLAGPIGQRFDSNLYTIEKILIENPGQVGADYRYIVRVTALADITNVNVTEHLPEGVTYVGSTPDVAKSGNDLSWGYASMMKGDKQDTIITVRPNNDGDFVTATKVCVDPVARLAMRAGTPRLAIEKVGPSTAELDSAVNFNVKVTNIGTAQANNVVIVDNLPEGLRGTEAQPTYTVGNLGIGESKVVSVPVTAVAQGDWLNKAVANASNAASVEAQAPIRVVQSKLRVTKTGPDRLFIYRNAAYNITVTNDGTTTLENVSVTDDLPRGTNLVSVSGQPATQNKDKVVWNIASLAPGQSLTDSVTLTSTEPQTTTNKVTAVAGTSTGKTISATDSATTIWEGPPGVLTEIVDNVDPIRVGDGVVYKVTITNQGKYREINSQIRVIFSDEVTPLSCSDKTASVNGKIVTLPDVIIRPGGVITFTIQAKGEQAGVATTRLEFNSSFLPKAINKDETTYVY